MRTMEAGSKSLTKQGDINMIARPLEITGFVTRDRGEVCFNQPVKALLEFHRFRMAENPDVPGQTIISPAGQHPGIGYEDHILVKAAYRRKSRPTRILSTTNFARLHDVETSDLQSCTPTTKLHVPEGRRPPARG